MSYECTFISRWGLGAEAALPTAFQGTSGQSGVPGALAACDVSICIWWIKATENQWALIWPVSNTVFSQCSSRCRKKTLSQSQVWRIKTEWWGDNFLRPLISTQFHDLKRIYTYWPPIAMAARSKEWTVFASSNAGIVDSNPTQDMDVCIVCVYLCYSVCR
jgi:hypothetical protein